MSELDLSMQKFRRRVRLLQAWKGLAIGACVGGLASLILALLDWRGVALTSWPVLLGVIAAAMALGALLGAFRRVTPEALARSIDRRAQLKDRLSGALDPQESEFDAAQRADALNKLKDVKPREVYPVKVGPWQYGGIVMGVLASSVFLLGNTPIGLTTSQKAERAELQKAAVEVERVAKPILDEPDPELADERKLAEELKRFAEKLERGRKDRAAALQEANDLMQKADELTRRRFQESEQSLQQAQTAMDAALAKELEKQGMTPEQAKAALNGMREQGEAAQLRDEIEALERQLEADARQGEQGGSTGEPDQKQKQPNRSNLSPEQRQRLQEQLEALKERMKNLEISQKAREFLERLMSQPEWKELQEMAKKLREAQEQVQQTGRTELTEEQVKEMQKRLEELAEKFKDDQAMRELIQQMMEAMKKSQGG